MAFEQGHEKKAGRKKGTPNRVSDAARAFLAKLTDDYILNEGELGLRSDLSKIRPVDRVQLHERMFKYSIPVPAAEKEENSESESKYEVIVRHVANSIADEDEQDSQDEESSDYSVD